MQIEIRVGSIVKQADCEAIVNSANERMRAGSGVCGAIHAAAGPQLEECSSRLAPLSVSEAKITPAFGLPNRWVIHTRGPHYFLYDGDPKAALASCIRNVLQVAELHGVRRLAIPAISTGVFKYPIREAASVIINALCDPTGTGSSVELVRVMLLNDLDASCFREALALRVGESCIQRL